MSAEQSGGLANEETIGSGAESEVVIDSAAIMSFFQESQALQPAAHKHRAHKRRVRAAAELDAARRRRTSPSRRCACGSCYTCRENARWEQIFQEKFADPTYYDRRSVSFRSPLHTL